VIARPFLFSGLALVVVLAVVSAVDPAVAAVFEPRDFASPADEARYKSMIDELRCPKCQNQNIADSDAPLAKDLRREVFRMIGEGRSDTEILDYMVARYGDFVLYRPPFKGVTLVLWLGPALLVAFGLVVLWRTLRRRNSEGPSVALSNEERARLDAMLESDDS
jgi:cytochrome c-type biogenesis protein CcmH